MYYLSNVHYPQRIKIENDAVHCLLLSVTALLVCLVSSQNASTLSQLKSPRDDFGNAVHSEPNGSVPCFVLLTKMQYYGPYKLLSTYSPAPSDPSEQSQFYVHNQAFTRRMASSELHDGHASKHWFPTNRLSCASFHSTEYYVC